MLVPINHPALRSKELFAGISAKAVAARKKALQTASNIGDVEAEKAAIQAETSQAAIHGAAGIVASEDVSSTLLPETAPAPAAETQTAATEKTDRPS